MNEKKIFSDIVELDPWDFCDDSLLPGPVLLQACNMQMKAFSYFYWNMFNRIKDKKVTFEIPLINLRFFDESVDFLNERRLLFQTEINSVYEDAMLQIHTKMFKSFHPFTPVADCVWNGVECLHANEQDWTLGEFEEPPHLNSELTSLIMPSNEIEVENVSFMLNRLNISAEWKGPAISRHRVLQPYCEYGYMGGFMNYTAFILALGKDALANSDKDYLPAYLKEKYNYRNWRMWYSIKKAFFFDDSIKVLSYYTHFKNKDYIKHEIYLERPRILKSVILEEYVCEE